MKVSQLPPDVKEKALYYQKKDNSYYSNSSDFLHDAFDWGETTEGTEYWYDWDKKKITEKDSIVESITKQFLERSNVGIQKYGVTLDREDLSLIEWLEHTKQEQMDSVLYLEKAIQQLKRQNENMDSESSVQFGQPDLEINFPHRQS